MVGIKGLLSRVRKMEPKLGRYERAFGSVEQMEADFQARIDAGLMDPLDGADLMVCIRRFIEAGY
jgi:hypothetical protein